MEILFLNGKLWFVWFFMTPLVSIFIIIHFWELLEWIIEFYNKIKNLIIKFKK